MKFEKDGKVYESFEDAVDAFFLGDRKILPTATRATTSPTAARAARTRCGSLRNIQPVDMHRQKKH